MNWDELKLESNLLKHGLDFANAGVVLDSRSDWMLNAARWRATHSSFPRGAWER
ncbi:MAG: hypothetical protein V3U88_03530 [Methylococcales bacterium]